MTSAREGWGLVATEANACGTPAIVYDVPGLRYSVRNQFTGLVVEPEPARLTEASVRLATDPSLYSRLASEGKRWSSTLSFDRAAEIVSNTVELHRRDREAGPPMGAKA
jgi:glycosyltransferase involved in cell wall biosynthesis